MQSSICLWAKPPNAKIIFRFKNSSDSRKRKSKVVKPPSVADSPVNLECRLLKKINLKTEKHNINQNNMIIGEVVGIYIDDKFIIKDKINSLAMRAISRMGYSEYSEVNLKFMMTPPKWK